LIFVLSGGTILWGAMTGTYFGVEAVTKIPFFSNLIVPEIASFGADNIQFMMHLSFLIGAIHLTLAHMLRFFQFINSSKAISELGWVAFVWGIFLVVEMLVLGKELPGFGKYFFLIGLTLVAFFFKEDSNFVKSMMLSLANLPLSLINGFSDVGSYVRLFAVGMATTVVAASFNEMISAGSVVSDNFRVFETSCNSDPDFPQSVGCYPSGGFSVYKEDFNNTSKVLLRTYNPYLDGLKSYNPRLNTQIKDLYQNCFNPAVGPCIGDQDSPGCPHPQPIN